MYRNQWDFFVLCQTFSLVLFSLAPSRFVLPFFFFLPFVFIKLMVCSTYLKFTNLICFCFKYCWQKEEEKEEKDEEIEKHTKKKRNKWNERIHYTSFISNFLWIFDEISVFVKHICVHIFECSHFISLVKWNVLKRAHTQTHTHTHKKKKCRDIKKMN